MTKAALLTATMLVGCATVADLRDRTAFIDAQSQKDLAEIRSCVSHAWEARSGTTEYSERDQGFSLALKYAVYSNTMAAVVVDVDDNGSRRHVVVHARKGDESNKLRAEVEACI